MDKQPFDNIENRIRQAAENMSPPVTEEAWEKMELLLDKEFNKKRRRGFIWWWYLLLLPLIVSPAIFYFQNKRQPADSYSKNISTTQNSRKEISKIKSEPDNSALQNTIKDKESDLPPIPLPKEEGRPTNKTPLSEHQNSGSHGNHLVNEYKGVKKDNVASKPGQRKVNRDNSNDIRDGLDNDNAVVNIEGKMNLPERKNFNSPGNDQLNIKEGVDTANQVVVSNAPSGSKNDLQKDSLVNQNKVEKTRVTAKAADNKKGFYLIASVSADATAVKKFTTDNRKPVYGIAIGYKFNHRLSVQTGFYPGRKIYTAAPNDYKIKQGTYLSTVRVLSIDADCYIYEIPISLRYDLIAGKKFKLYATTGLSSFIIKKENYNYHVIGTGGYYRKAVSYKHNKNYMSSANLSLGVEQKLSGAFYIQAEPYIKAPLSGIGDGKVKLNSAGLLFGIKYQPVKKIKKK